MENSIRANSVIKLSTSDGSKINYEFTKGTSPFEVARAMLVNHGVNVGFAKLRDDMAAFLDELVAEAKKRNAVMTTYNCGVKNCGDGNCVHKLLGDKCPSCGRNLVMVTTTGFIFCSAHESICDYEVNPTKRGDDHDK